MKVWPSFRVSLLVGCVTINSFGSTNELKVILVICSVSVK
jgi:hypothetical protein